MKKKIILDSFALLAYLKGENGYEKVKKLLSGNNPLLMNDINIGETFYILAKKRGFDKAEYFLNVILPSLPISPVSNTLQDVIQAANLKARYPISFADCFVIATAIKEKATIITGDPDFKRVENLVKIDWL